MPVVLCPVKQKQPKSPSSGEALTVLVSPVRVSFSVISLRSSAPPSSVISVFRRTEIFPAASARSISSRPAESLLPLWTT